MRLISSTPQQRAFYTEHGRSLRTYSAVGWVGQTLSAASLALALFSLLSDAIAGRGLSLASAVIVAAAVLIAVFIELANRVLARPSIKPVVVKDQFADDPDADRRHKTVTRWSRAGLFAVGGLSFVLSYMGSLDAGQMIVDAPPPAPVDSLNLAATNAIDAASATFAADTAVLLAPYNQRSAAARQRFAAIKAEREKAAVQFASCADAGNKWCKGKRSGIFGQIDAARAELSSTLATIATERGAAVAAALQRRDAEQQRIRDDFSAVTAAAVADHASASLEAEAEAATNGYLFAVLTLVGQLLFYLTEYLSLTILAGSKIDERLEPNEFSGLPPVLSDFKAVVAHRVERGARRLIAYIFGQRERLDAPLPYVSAYKVDEDDPASILNASGTAPELLESDPVATNHAPGFYRRADDPHTVKDKTPLTQLHTSAPTQETVTTPDGETLAKSFVQSRVKMYRQRVGDAKQRAKVQQRKKGKVNTKTANAITNNQQKLDYYSGLLKQVK